MFGFFFILSATLSNAQEHYVEVVVTDTLMVEPQEWIMLVSVRPEMDFSMDTTTITNNSTVQDNPRHPARRAGTSMEALKTLAAKHGGVLWESKTEKIVTGNMYEAEEIQLKFTTRNQMEAFSKATREFNDVNLMVIDVRHLQLAPFQQMLEARLFTAGRQKAARLAALANKKLGTLQIISEITESEAGSLKSFFEMLVRDGGEGRRRMRQFTDQIKLEKSLKLRFALQ